MSASFEGHITEINGDEFTAKLVDEDGRELFAEFDVASLPSGRPLEVGDVFDAPEMKLRDLGRRRAEDVARINEGAEAQLAALLPLMD